MIDAYGRAITYLRLSVTDRCDLRCAYCMPERMTFLPRAEMLSFAELDRLASGFIRQGVRKLRLTGGEPLLRKRLPELVARLARIDGIDDLALTTNGALLAMHARTLREAGLRRITVSLDTLDPDAFRALSGGRGELRHVLAGIEAASAAGFGPVKLNCVVQRGVNDAGIETLAAFARTHGHVLRFIEYMDVGTCNGWSRARVMPSIEVRDRIAAAWPLRPLDPNYRGEVAERYAYEDGRGEVGFVSSVTAPFCGDCHRARVSADGQLYTCLFAGQGHDLRAVLVQGEEALAAHVAALWSLRADRYSEVRSEAGASRKHVEMYLVGG